MQTTERQSLSAETQWAQRMVKELWSKDLCKPKNYTDLEFRCGDGKVEAHRAYLQKYCAIIRKITEGVEFTFEPKLVIVLPEVRIKTVRNFLKLLYTGAVNLTSELEMDSIREFAFDQLGFEMALDCVKDPVVNARSFRSRFWNSNDPHNTFRDAENWHTNPERARSTLSNSTKIGSSNQKENDSHFLHPTLDAHMPSKVLSNDRVQVAQKSLLPKGISSSILMHLKKEMCKAIVGPSGPFPDDRIQLMEPVCVVDEENEDLSSIQTTLSDVVGEEKYIIPKKDSLYGLRYTLDAPTSGLVKVNDDRMTYINMGKFYELTLDYLENPNFSSDDVGVVRSIIMVLFRGKIMKDEELKAWHHWHSRQLSSGFSFKNKNIIEADMFHSSGIRGKVYQLALNAIEIFWSPKKSPAKLNIAVQCLSTDFSDQKGVRGEPLHLQIDTYLKPNDPEECHVVNHRGYAQIKIFRDKGAERKLRDEAKQIEKISHKVASKKYPFYALQPSSEQTEFYSMVDTNHPPFLFQPKSSNNRETLKIAFQKDDENVSDEEDEQMTKKRQRLDDRIMIFLKQSEEDTYTPLHVVPPTVLGLKDAIKSKCTLPFEIRQILRRSKHGAIVKFDDEMIQFYSHANTFTMELSSLTENGETLYDLTLTEA